MCGRHVFGMVAFVFRVKREEEEGGAGRSSGRERRELGLILLRKDSEDKFAELGE